MKYPTVRLEHPLDGKARVRGAAVRWQSSVVSSQQGRWLRGPEILGFVCALESHFAVARSPATHETR